MLGERVVAFLLVCLTDVVGVTTLLRSSDCLVVGTSTTGSTTTGLLSSNWWQVGSMVSTFTKSGGTVFSGFTRIVSFSGTSSSGESVISGLLFTCFNRVSVCLRQYPFFAAIFTGDEGLYFPVSRL